jgi:Raf kinase inhibitor-like YbhB/YbcL family protein
MISRLPRVLSLMLPLVAALAAGCTGPSEVPPEMRRLALDLPPTDGPLNVIVRSDGFEPGQEIPEANTAYGQNLSPTLNWSNIPESAQSIVVLAEDSDVKDGPYVHWVIFNIPAASDGIRQGIGPQGLLSYPLGAHQGTNSAGTIGYTGPKPPVGDPTHHYHFEVFALNTMLKQPVGANRTDVVKAMAGHVVGKGQIMGSYR